MVGVSGVCARLFGVLRDARPRAINVVLITQAGSEHSICLAVPREQGEAAVALVRREFRDEIDAGEIQPVKPPRTDVSCLAIVGDGMRERRGTAARMFGALAKAEVNIIAIAQGSSERNISVIVRNDEVARGLQAVHQAFIGGGGSEE
jgi:aspartokinase/homoserine dehydrogenase 1